MQKRLRTLATLAAAAFAAVGDAAPIPQEWAVDVSRVKQYQFQANRGDTMELKATFWHDGEPFDLGGDVFRLYWQTNAMGSVYWSAPATAVSNTVSAVFANTMDPGAPIVYGFLGATSGNYRASFSIRYAPGPGAVPNALPLPAATIDFAKVEVLNPPYYTKAETDTAIREGLAVAASSATNYTDEAASALRDDIAAAATLTPIYSDTPTFSEWVCQPNIVTVHWDDFRNMWQTSPAESSNVSEEAYNPNATNIVFLLEASGGEVTATRTRTDVIGYTLGTQSDKPLQPKGDYAPATNIAKSALSSEVQTSLGKADTALQTAGGEMTGSLAVNTRDNYRVVLGALPGVVGGDGIWWTDDVGTSFSGTCGIYCVSLLGNLVFISEGNEIFLPDRTGTLALTSDIPSLSGQTFDFATTQGVMDALKTVIETLGGTVVNAPSTAIPQGE